MLTLITYGSKSTRSPLGDTAPLKYSPLLPSCLKFQKSSTPRKKCHFKILHSPAPYNQGGGGRGSYSCFGDFNIHHKDWLTYSDGTNRPGELFLFILVFVLQWLSIHWEILVMFSLFPLTFYQTAFNWHSTASRLESYFEALQVPINYYYLFYWSQKDERLSRPWSHPVVLNIGPMDWESSAQEL